MKRILATAALALLTVPTAFAADTRLELPLRELINSPQGPWLQMLQRVYYTDDPIDQVIADAKAQMKAIAAE